MPEQEYVTFRIDGHDPDGTPLPGERVDGGQYVPADRLAAFLLHAVRAAGTAFFDGDAENESAALWAAVESLGFSYGDLTSLAIVAAEIVGDEATGDCEDDEPAVRLTDEQYASLDPMARAFLEGRI